MSFLRFLFLDGGRDGLQSNFWASFMNTSKPFQKRFHIVYNETSVRAAKQQKSATGVSQERGCLNLAQLENACVAAGRSLLTVVGQNRAKQIAPRNNRQQCLDASQQARSEQTDQS